MAKELGTAVNDAMTRALDTACDTVAQYLPDLVPEFEGSPSHASAVMDQAKELYRRGQAPFGVFAFEDIGYVRAAPYVLAPPVRYLLNKYRKAWGIA